MDIAWSAVLVLACVFGFYMAWNIGANDVANAMGTSVGSRALTMKQAVLIAAVFEFAGAFLVGSHVTDTVRKGILDVGLFEGHLETLMYGMLAALLAAGAWLQIATYFGWPVSTTHSIIGAIVGFGLVAGGTAGVDWEQIGRIVISWITSPLLSGAIAFIVFSAIRRTMINVPDPVRSTKRWAPLFIFLVFGILTLVTLFKGLKNLKLDLDFGEALLAAGLIGIGASGIGWLLIRRMAAPFAGKDTLPPPAERVQQGEAQLSTREDFRFVEKIFGRLQILSACFVAFAHGANDVANAIGPLAAVVSLAAGGTAALTAKVPVPFWILGVGGVGIVIGLATWGWRVIETIGRRITELTPTRGFSAEFAAATTIVVASRLGIPISTTHTLVGAVIGVGLARGIASLDPRVVRDILTSWLITLPAGAGMAIAFFYIIKAILNGV